MVHVLFLIYAYKLRATFTIQKDDSEFLNNSTTCTAILIDFPSNTSCTQRFLNFSLLKYSHKRREHQTLTQQLDLQFSSSLPNHLNTVTHNRVIYCTINHSANGMSWYFSFVTKNHIHYEGERNELCLHLQNLFTCLNSSPHSLFFFPMKVHVITFFLLFLYKQNFRV